MNVWRCAARRPWGTPCRRLVGTRARWDPVWRCWIGIVCDRCWRDALQYEPDRDAALALDPNAPDWVVERLAQSSDIGVVANVASRGDRLPIDLRQLLSLSPSPLVQQALGVRDRELVPAWSLYRTTPRPGVTAASLAAVVVAVVAATVVEMRRSDPVDGAPTPPPSSAAVSITGVSSASSAPLNTHDAAVSTPPTTSSMVVVTATPPVVTPPTLPVATSTSSTTSTVPTTPIEPTTVLVPLTPLSTAAVRPPVDTAPVPSATPPAPVPTPPAGTPAPPVVPATVPPASQQHVLSFEVPFAGTVRYVASHGITQVELRAPDGSTTRGTTSAEGSGPAGTWTATVTVDGAWAGEFVSEG